MLQDFIRDGYVEVDIDDSTLHNNINDKLSAHENPIPRNDGLIESVPELSAIIDHPNVVSALKTLLGDSYIQHPHKEVFLDNNWSNTNPHRDWSSYYSVGHNILGKKAVSYFNYWNLHHHCRCLQVFYYPVSIPDTKRGTIFIPESQYYNSIDGVAYYYREPFRMRGSGKVVIAHQDLFHMTIKPKNRVEIPRFVVKFVFLRSEEPKVNSQGTPKASWSGIYNDDVYNYHWDWYRGVSYKFPSYTESYTDTLENEITNTRELINLIYAMGGSSDVGTVIDHIMRIKKEKTLPREEVLSHMLALMDSTSDIVSKINEGIIWDKRAAFIDILANKGEYVSNWLEWLSSEKSPYCLGNLCYGTPLLFSGNVDALNLVVKRFKDRDVFGRGINRVLLKAIISILKLSKTCGVIPDIESEINELCMSGSDPYLNIFAKHVKKKWF